MNLELCIRTVLESGELWPGMEAQIHHLMNTSNLSTQEQTMLQILQDAIQDGCVKRIQLSRSSATLLLY